MPGSPRRLALIGSIAERIPHDPVVDLARLWKAFEQSGTVSAYIAYRIRLAHLARDDGPVRRWASEGPH